MNTSFYAALDRIRWGIAVTLEFVGPLGVAIAGSRRRLDLVWAGLAALGIALLSPAIAATSTDSARPLRSWREGSGPPTSTLAARVGAAFEGGDGLALAMIIAGALLLPFGIVAGGAT